MSNGTTHPEPTLGFLTILEGPGGALLGGLLILNRRGRPIEFHCTAAIVASRAEEILFGPTLRPHFYCERIGAALLAKAKAGPSLLVVNQLDSWPIADETSVPVVLVDPRPVPTPSEPSGETEASPTGQLADEPRATNPTASANLDRLDPVQRPEVERILGEVERYIDLAEPFERIAEAIRETGLLGGQDERDPGSNEVPHARAA